MKSIELILLAILAGPIPILDGQDAAPPAVDLYSGQKEPEVTATISPEPLVPNVPELSQLDEAFKQKSLGKEADQRRLHIEWRELKNRVVNDPSVRAAKAAALAARTDLEKRDRLRNYYNVYYDRMSALASSAEMTFKGAPPGTIDSPPDAEKLGKLLAYHIVQGAVTSKELTTRKAQTLGGANLDIKVTNGQITVNDAHVIKADVKASNGVIYVIDKVLIPPAPGAAPPTADSSPTPTPTPEPKHHKKHGK